MNEQNLLDERDVFVRRYEYDTSIVYAVDLGRGTAASVDVIDNTAMIIPENSQEQYEIDVPAGTVEAFIKNGIVTIEIEQ